MLENGDGKERTARREQKSVYESMRGLGVGVGGGCLESLWSRDSLDFNTFLPLREGTDRVVPSGCNTCKHNGKHANTNQ